MLHLFGCLGGVAQERVSHEIRSQLVINGPLREHRFGKPLTSTLLTSTFAFRSGGFPLRGFELEWSLVATSLEGFSVTSHERRVPGALFKGIKRVRRAPPGTKNQSGHVKSDL